MFNIQATSSKPTGSKRKTLNVALLSRANRRVAGLRSRIPPVSVIRTRRIARVRRRNQPPPKSPLDYINRDIEHIIYGVSASTAGVPGDKAGELAKQRYASLSNGSLTQNIKTYQSEVSIEYQKSVSDQQVVEAAIDAKFKATLVKGAVVGGGAVLVGFVGLPLVLPAMANTAYGKLIAHTLSVALQMPSIKSFVDPSFALGSNLNNLIIGSLTGLQVAYRLYGYGAQAYDVITQQGGAGIKTVALKAAKSTAINGINAVLNPCFAAAFAPLGQLAGTDSWCTGLLSVSGIHLFGVNLNITQWFGGQLGASLVGNVVTGTLNTVQIPYVGYNGRFGGLWNTMASYYNNIDAQYAAMTASIRQENHRRSLIATSYMPRVASQVPDVTKSAKTAMSLKSLGILTGVAYTATVAGMFFWDPMNFTFNPLNPRMLYYAMGIVPVIGTTMLHWLRPQIMKVMENLRVIKRAVAISLFLYRTAKFPITKVYKWAYAQALSSEVTGGPLSWVAKHYESGLNYVRSTRLYKLLVRMRVFDYLYSLNAERVFTMVFSTTMTLGVMQGVSMLTTILRPSVNTKTNETETYDQWRARLRKDVIDPVADPAAKVLGVASTVGVKVLTGTVNLAGSALYGVYRVGEQVVMPMTDFTRSMLFGEWMSGLKGTDNVFEAVGSKVADGGVFAWERTKQVIDETGGAFVGTTVDALTSIEFPDVSTDRIYQAIGDYWSEHGFSLDFAGMFNGLFASSDWDVDSLDGFREKVTLENARDVIGNLRAELDRIRRLSKSIDIERDLFGNGNVKGPDEIREYWEKFVMEPALSSLNIAETSIDLEESPVSEIYEAYKSITASFVFWGISGSSTSPFASFDAGQRQQQQQQDLEQQRQDLQKQQQEQEAQRNQKIEGIAQTIRGVDSRTVEAADVSFRLLKINDGIEEYLYKATGFFSKLAKMTGAQYSDAERVEAMAEGANDAADEAQRELAEINRKAVQLELGLRMLHTIKIDAELDHEIDALRGLASELDKDIDGLLSRKGTLEKMENTLTNYGNKLNTLILDEEKRADWRWGAKVWDAVGPERTSTVIDRIKEIDPRAAWDIDVAIRGVDANNFKNTMTGIATVGGSELRRRLEKNLGASRLTKFWEGMRSLSDSTLKSTDLKDLLEQQVVATAVKNEFMEMVKNKWNNEYGTYEKTAMETTMRALGLPEEVISNPFDRHDFGTYQSFWGTQRENLGTLFDYLSTRAEQVASTVEAVENVVGMENMKKGATTIGAGAATASIATIGLKATAIAQPVLAVSAGVIVGLDATVYAMSTKKQLAHLKFLKETTYAATGPDITKTYEQLKGDLSLDPAAYSTMFRGTQLLFRELNINLSNAEYEIPQIIAALGTKVTEYKKETEVRQEFEEIVKQGVGGEKNMEGLHISDSSPVENFTEKTRLKEIGKAAILNQIASEREARELGFFGTIRERANTLLGLGGRDYSNPYMSISGGSVRMASYYHAWEEKLSDANKNYWLKSIGLDMDTLDGATSADALTPEQQEALMSVFANRNEYAKAEPAQDDIGDDYGEGTAAILGSIVDELTGRSVGDLLRTYGFELVWNHIDNTTALGNSNNHAVLLWAFGQNNVHNVPDIFKRFLEYSQNTLATRKEEDDQ